MSKLLSPQRRTVNLQKRQIICAGANVPIADNPTRVWRKEVERLLEKVIWRTYCQRGVRLRLITEVQNSIQARIALSVFCIDCEFGSATRNDAVLSARRFCDPFWLAGRS